MENLPAGTADRSERDYLEAMALFDVPAYIRRARGVEEAWSRLLARCRARRDEWLAMPKLRLAMLHALTGGALPEPLSKVFDELAPTLQAPLAPAPGRVPHALALYDASAERFNRRWSAFLAELDLDEINRLRDGYNRYYVLEKSCALRSDLKARHGFVPLAMLTMDDVRREFPPLPVIGLPTTTAAAPGPA